MKATSIIERKAYDKGVKAGIHKAKMCIRDSVVYRPFFHQIFESAYDHPFRKLYPVRNHRDRFCARSLLFLSLIHI